MKIKSKDILIFAAHVVGVRLLNDLEEARLLRRRGVEAPLGAGAAPARRRAVVGRRRRRAVVGRPRRGWRGDLLQVVVDVEGRGPLLVVVLVVTKIVV